MEICEKKESLQQEPWDTPAVREASQLDIYNRFGLNYVNQLIDDHIYPFDDWTDTLLELQEKSKKLKNGNLSDKCLYYEVTTTHPDRDVNQKNNMIKRLRKYTQAELFEGHFEIGKRGLYHYHFLIKTKKYLRKKQIENCNDNYRVSIDKVRNLDAYKNYINKEPQSVIGWEDIYQ